MNTKISFSCQGKQHSVSLLLLLNTVFLGVMGTWGKVIASEPFDSCPSEAFLIQGEPSSLYSVNLVSGYYELLTTSMNTTGSVNAIGFNLADNYLYGYDKASTSVVRIGKDYQVQPLTVSNFPDVNFFVGDVSPVENALYFYRRSSDAGFYKISLDSTDSNYLTAVLQPGTSSWDLNIYDMAFHPTNGKIYAVENNGNLHEIDLTNTSTTLLLDVGKSGVFGAQYFDQDGFFYFGRNDDGHVFRINIDTVQDGGNQVSDGTFSPAITGNTWTFTNYPNNTNINGSSGNDLVVINENMLGSGFNYNGSSGYDRLVLGNIASNYTVTSQGTGAYRVTWPNGKYLNLNGVEEILYGNLASSVTATLFTVGPSSTKNDGARCATAGLITENIYDFGDAPDAYGTSLDGNGARHEVGGLYLGAAVSAETSPRSSDTKDDGIGFVTNVSKAISGNGSSIVSVEASQAGYVNAWIDWDQNQVFDSDELVIDGHSVSAGSNTIVISVPSTATPGSTWSRFRLTTTQTSEPLGGAVNGEVEDYQITVLDASGYTTVCYPSSTGYVTLAYEDKWPQTGDYDFNDVVVRYRSCVNKIGSSVEQFTMQGILVSVGAYYHNAFAVRLEGVSPSQIDTSKTTHVVNSEFLTGSPVEEGRTETILTIIPDTASIGTKPTGCTFFRTEDGCDASGVVSFNLSISLTAGVDESVAPSGRFDPFIYGVAGYYHGDDLTSIDPRGWEVHIKNQAPTEAFNTNLYGAQVDASDAAQGIYFQTNQGHPFAIEIGTSWRPPKEQVGINEAYDLFIPFAESNGQSNTSWFDAIDTNKVISEDN